MRLSALLALALLSGAAHAATPKHIGKAAADPLVIAAVKAKFPKGKITSLTGGFTLDSAKSVSNHFYVVHLVERGKHYTGPVSIDMREKSPRTGVGRVKKVMLSHDAERDEMMATFAATLAELRKSGGNPDIIQMLENRLRE